MHNHDFDDFFEGDFRRRTRPPSAATRVRQSYNKEILVPTFGYERDARVPNSASRPCNDFLHAAGLLEDFLTLVERVGLTSHMMDDIPQYYGLTKTFF